MVTMLYLEIDLFAIFMICLMLSSNRQNRALGQPDQRSFNCVLITTLVLLFFDGGMWLLDGKTFAGARTLNMIVSSAYDDIQV